ncbi:MAG: DUF1905 domain-containing protein [Dehalococcoidia bacterium]
MERFRATIEPAGRGGHVVAVPDDAAVALEARHMMRVRGTLAGTPYRSNLARMKGRLILGVHKATLEAAGKGTGEEAEVTIEFDPDER